jgi:MFS transporter, AAHS family, 4-hydroxybenzoate transporter
MKTNCDASNPRGSIPPNLSIEGLIDAQPLAVRQLAIVALCFAVAALDGLDLAIVGFVAPAIRADWPKGEYDNF